MNTPSPELRETLRSTNAGARALFTQLATAPELAEHRPVLEQMHAVFTDFFDSHSLLAVIAETKSQLALEYNEMRAAFAARNGADGIRGLFEFHGNARLKLGEWVSWDDSELRQLEKMRPTLARFVEIAPAFYATPLREPFLFLVPIMAAYLTPEQLGTLTQKHPSVVWLDVI